MTHTSNPTYVLFAIYSHWNYVRTEPAISTTHCSRLYGIFADEAKCDVFWNCWNGEASRYQCSPGLAYDREARVCMWADQVAECKNEGKKQLHTYYFCLLIMRAIVTIVCLLSHSCYYRGGERFQLSSNGWNIECRFIFTSRPSRGLSEILYLHG